MHRNKREIVPLLACGVILSWQLFLPGFIGLANNRDFAKVAGRLCIGRVDTPSSYYVYFHPDFERAPRYCWDSQIPSSEAVLAHAASFVEKHLADPARFDIRWLGAVHAMVVMAAWWLLSRALRPLAGAAWWIAQAAALWMFLDISYIAYLNSFYTDAAAILGAGIMLAAALWLVSEASQRAPFVWFSAGALLFLTAKAQHAALAPLLACFLLLSVGRSVPRVLTVMCALAMVAGAAWTVLGIPDSYKAQARFNLAFSKILPASPSPRADVGELGLSESDLPLIGQHAFLPYSPAFDPAWLDAFSRRTSFARVALFWLRHPWRMLTTVRGDLDNQAWRRRPAEFSNYQPEAGRPPGALTGRFASSSALWTRISRAWPTSVVVWYALVFFIGMWRARSALGFSRAVAQVALLAATLGAVELFIASLADARETDRHLLLFHLFTDWTMFLALVYFLNSRSSASIRG
jgi:hypothetical protein